MRNPTRLRGAGVRAAISRRAQANGQPGDTSSRVIYFLWWGDHIKVGKTKDFLGRRLPSHRKDAALAKVGLKVLAVVQGDDLAEEAVKHYFRPWALPGETERFYPVKPLLRYIRWLRDQGFCCAGEPATNDLVVVHQSEWEPRADRSKAPAQTLLIAEDELTFSEPINTDNDFWTPPWLVRLARTALGGIDLDPATHKDANEIVGAETFFTRNDDGLNRDWFGRVWMNPPYGDATGVFIAKLLDEISSGRVTAALACVSLSAISAEYMRRAIRRADLLIILTGRVSFVGPLGGTSNPGGTALLYYGPDRPRVTTVFGAAGECLIRIPVSA